MQLNENIRICPHGHYYEINKHSRCPYCKSTSDEHTTIEPNIDDVKLRMSSEDDSQISKNVAEDKTELLY